MNEETLERRVSALERAVQTQVTIRDLDALQAVLSGQIVQLGVEMRVGFSALREEIHAGDEETRRALRDENRVGDEETRGLIEQRTAEILAVVAAGDAETRRHAQMLHEEVIAQIKTIRNG